MQEFTLNENNEIVYAPDEENPSAGEEDLYGQPIDEIPVEGDDTADQVEDTETDAETDSETSADNPLDAFNADSPLPVVLSDEVTEALLAGSPAGGALGSSTLTYFDRIVSGLSSDYKYVAYRTDVNDSYDGVLIYGRHYEYDGTHITFGKDAVAVTVDRTSGNNSTTTYKVESAEDWFLTPVQNGSVVYYSNVREGLPVLGGYKPPVGLSSLLAVAFVSACASVILSKILRNRG